MEEQYTIYRFTFIDNRTKTKCEIFARSEKKAIEIIDLWNSFQDIYIWSIPKRKRHFIKLVYTSIPPYELENEQIQTIEGWKKHYEKYIQPKDI